MNNATYPAKITGLRRQHLFFALCWTAYFSTYIGLLNLAMACASSPGLMAVIWTLNGAAQSAVWSPLLRLTVERLPGVEAMRASVRYSTTVPFGTLAAYGLAALCSAMGCWRAVFAAAGLFLTATAL